MRTKILVAVFAIIGGILVLSPQNAWCWIDNSYYMRALSQHSQVGNVTQYHHVVGHTPWQQDLSHSDENEEQQGSTTMQTGDQMSGMSGARVVVFQERKTNPNGPK